jgi:hypothetical protein
MGVVYNSRIVTDGLVLCLDAANRRSYPGSGTTWYDMSGNLKHGTLTNGPTFSATNGGSLVFDGTDDYVSTGALSGSFSSFSVFIWFYPTSVTNYENPIDCNYAYNANTGNIGPRLEVNGVGNLAWVYSNNVNDNNTYYSHAVITSGLAESKWHCSAITYSGSSNSSSTYYNGLQTLISRTTSGSPTGFIGTINGANIGRGFNRGGPERIFTGRVPFVCIYNKSLSSQEILQNYNATKGRFL